MSKTPSRNNRIRLLNKRDSFIDFKNSYIFIFKFKLGVEYGFIWKYDRKPKEKDLINCDFFSEIISNNYSNEDLKIKEKLYRKVIETIGDNISYNLILKNENDKIIYSNTNKTEELDELNEPKQITSDNKKIGTVYLNSDGNIQESKITKKHKKRFLNKLIGSSSQMKKVVEMIDIVSENNSTVIIRGESGTGKEEFANLIHQRSRRSKGPFIPINCGAIPENLLESELFGYEKGAFTGASTSGKIGKFEAADGGTLFLDEIGDMSGNLQVKLLRTLQEKNIQRIGGNELIPIDVRIICATNKNLEDMISKGEFREDLYYRINVIPIIAPSLKGKEKDIRHLANYYVKKYCIDFKKGFKYFNRETLNFLSKYEWPGNIRELINVVEYGVATSSGDMIGLENLPRNVIKSKKFEKTESKVVNGIRSKNKNKKNIFKLLDEYGYSTDDKKRLAEDIGISLATLYRWIKDEENKNEDYR
jgi:transcriptional regulator with PAS, ATPase and Fis domain